MGRVTPGEAVRSRIFADGGRLRDVSQCMGIMRANGPPTAPTRMTKILILSVSAGNGHVRAAQALEAAVQSTPPHTAVPSACWWWSAAWAPRA